MRSLSLSVFVRGAVLGFARLPHLYAFPPGGGQESTRLSQEHAESSAGAAEGADAVPATPNAEGGKRKRKAEGSDKSEHADSDVSAAESIASGTTEGGAAAVSKTEAEGGTPETKTKAKRSRRSRGGGRTPGHQRQMRK